MDNIGISLLRHMKTYPVKTPQQLGSVIKGYRRERGLTQSEVGARVGLAQKDVSQIESTPGRAGLARVFKLLAGLDLELAVQPRRTTSHLSEW